MRVRDAHFFRRVPADVSEATKSGGIISIVAILTICWLVLTQFSEYTTSKHTTQLRLDSAKGSIDGGASIRINFNITMPHLPCQYASVHVADHVGAHKMGGQRNVHKVRLSRYGESLGMYEPHKYADGKMGGEHMAGHVFPWHKKEHTQGDASHRQAKSLEHLSADQRHKIGKVESHMQVAGKGAQAGRRLLSIPEPPSQSPPSPPSPIEVAIAVAADTSRDCPNWAKHQECEHNSGFMLLSCATACKTHATAETCAKWATEGRCKDASDFMSKVCPKDCGFDVGSAAVAEPAPVVGGGDEEGGAFTPTTPFFDGPLNANTAQFTKLLQDNAIVMVNFYAPWCFWSNRLTPAWSAVARRLHGRAYSQSVKFVKIDCTSANGKEVCTGQAIHAFPSVRIYRGSTHAFEPYEYGREENVLWLHLVKTAAETLVSAMQEAPAEQRQAYTQQIAHVSKDLRDVMDRRAKGLDEDWSEDALSAEEEVQEDRDLLDQIQQAVSSITGAKGAPAHKMANLAHLAPHEREAHAVTEHATDVVLGLLQRSQPERSAEDDAAEPWPESETHEGCNLFGYIDVSRAPGTLHFSPHSARHSFNFSSVNTTHHIDHLSFGLELSARQRSYLPKQVRSQLASLDGFEFIATLPHETQEHHVNIMPTSFAQGTNKPIETYQFTATSHGRTRDTLPSVLISYDVSPIHARIKEKSRALSEFLISLCAIVGGAVSVFGIVDAMVYGTANAVKKSIGKNY